MKINIKKRIVYIALVISMVINLYYNVPLGVYADSSSTLGTPEALGSPILNSKFSSENWDKWEMIVYGIYLSNFCIPLVDSYESAFTTNSGYGSNGSGLNAMKIGSGNDSANNEIIESLTTQVINFQAQTATSQLYVAYTKIENGTLATKTDPNNGGTIRAARFSDLFPLDSKPEDTTEEKSWVDLPNIAWHILSYNELEYGLNKVNEASLPTFYVKNGDKYIEVFDFTNAWDIQIMSAMINRAIESDNEDTFYSNYSKLYGEDKNGNDGVEIGFDSYGNITSNLDGKNIIILPASANQHLTETKKINLINSWVLNDSVVNVSENIVNNGKQAMTYEEHYINLLDLGGWLAEVIQFFQGCNYKGGGVSAFGAKDGFFLGAKGSEQEAGTVIMFKDTDSLLASGYTGSIIPELMKSAKLEDNSIPLKIEIISEASLFGDKDPVGNGALQNLVLSSSTLCNQLDTTQDFGMTSILTPSGFEEDLFTDEVIVANQAAMDVNNKSSSSYVTRQLINFMYDVYKSGSIDTDIGEITKDMVIDMTGAGKSWNEALNTVWMYYKAYNSEMIHTEYSADIITPGNRFTAVQIPSEELKQIANMFSGSDGNFTTQAAYIYVTYLRFYGINSSSILGEAGGNTTTLNKELFNSSAAKDSKLDNIGGIKSKEQREEEVLNLSYLMLTPDKEGIDYRNGIAKSNLTSFINNQYQAIVNNGNASGAPGKAGFLTVQSLEENPFTASLIEKYADIVIVIISIAIIVIIIAGLMMSKKFSWYLITVVIYINVILLLPSVGNISSTIPNKITNNLFGDKMTYWAISQQVADAEIVNSIKENNSNNQLLDELMSGLSLVSGDRTLTMKKDISSKVTTKLDENYRNAIQLHTARWILPIVMQQISASDESDINNYVYTSMLDTMDDASNVYMYYNPKYKESIGTVSSTTDGEYGDSIEPNDRKSKRYEDYVDTSKMNSYNGVNYRNTAYYDSNYNKMSHTYFYLLEAKGSAGTALCKAENGVVDYTNIESYQNYIDMNATSNIQAWESTAKHIEEVSDEYSRQDLSSIDSSYGYLLNSESVYNYMYQTVEDTFAYTETLGSLVGKIQGEYRDNSDGEQVRNNFMYATSESGMYTGETRDILDLQEFFTNNLPYMYKMWITAGGFDGKSGVFADREIEEHNYYEGNDISWLFRCNWAIKLMENKDFNGSCTVKDKDGERYKVDNMLNPKCYPENRPMIFSRAQQNAYELDDSDLSYVELKCVKVNEDTALRWTSLLNYASTPHMTKEIMLRQMAVDATMIFNNEFSTRTVASYKYALLPASLDLRSLSFDSIMKMIILNITKDASYVYGNTAETLISRIDVITAVLLLATAMVCTYIIPLTRNIIALVVLLLTAYAVIRSITSENKYKGRILIGALLTQGEIILIHTAYYMVFKLFVAMTSTDEVISVESVTASIESGNPVWAFIAIMAISIGYIVIMFRMTLKFIENREDLGFERYSMIANMISDKIQGGFNTVADRFSGTFGSHAGNGSWGRKEDKENTVDRVAVNVKQSKGDTVKVVVDNKDANNSKEYNIEIDNYYDNSDINVTNEKDRIDNEIEKGSRETT